jgi:hypothetical protein
MAFNVGDLVWFKREGSTPYVTGDASDAGLPVKHQLGGRGKAAISQDSAAKSGLSDAQGVPSIKFSEFPDALDSTDSVTDTFNPDGQHLGVRDEFEQPAPAGEVLLVRPHMLGQVVDTGRTQCDLHLGRAAVALVPAELRNEFGLLFLRDRHRPGLR